MREIAARYPVTYRKVGEAVAARGLGLDPHHWPSSAENYQIMLAIIAAMPPHVIPYWQMGDDTPWALIDWGPFLADLLADPTP